MSWLCSNFSLDGQRAIVTGASRGIGLALSRALYHAGAHVALAGRSSSTLTSAAKSIDPSGNKVFPLVCDVAEHNDIKSTFSTIRERWGKVDILINNAGIEERCDSNRVDESLWDRLMDVNLKGAFFCSQAAARLMSQGDGGSIVNLCSLTTSVGVPKSTVYGTTKTGLAGMTRALASEWATKHIRVNAIGPGYFQTDMTNEFYRDSNWTKEMLGKIPMGRFGDFQDLAGPVVFLCSPASSYITGQVLYIDGGYLACI